PASAGRRSSGAPVEGQPPKAARGPRALLSYAHLLLFGTLAVVRVEMHLAQADRFRRDLDEFVVLDPGKRALERHADRRRQPDCFILAGGTDVGQLLALQHV